MITLNIKPISVNQAYRGRRFSTPELTAYKQEIGLRLKRGKVPKGKLAVQYIFGVSSKASDADNLVKAFQDAIAEVYGFNDKMIYTLQVEKRDVKKGKEYVSFAINSWSEHFEGNQSVC